MTNLTKNVFLLITGTAIAMVLYFAFFGVRAGGINGVLVWDDYEGVIYYASRFIETPLAKYYYEYSFIPNAHANDYVDEALGGTSSVTDVYETDEDLGLNNEFMHFGGAYHHWSTGWQ